MTRIQSSLKVLLVADLARSQSFYRDVLGCEVNDWWAIRDDFAFGFKLLQAASPEDVRPNPPGQDQLVPWDVYAYVETHNELDALFAELSERGAEVIQQPIAYEQDWGFWKEFAITDPDGYALAFGSGKKNG